MVTTTLVGGGIAAVLWVSNPINDVRTEPKADINDVRVELATIKGQLDIAYNSPKKGSRKLR